MVPLLRARTPDSRRRTCRLCTALLICMLPACASRAPYPDTWSPTAPEAQWCNGFSGTFANQPSQSSPYDPDAPQLELDEVFFGTLLDGFDVSHFTLEPLGTDGIRVQPWVGSTQLREAVTLTPTRRACGPERWTIDTGWHLDGRSIATGLVWTGGVIVPAGFKGRYSLLATESGQLAIRVTALAMGTFSLVIPFRARLEDAWFLFDPVPATEHTDADR